MRLLKLDRRGELSLTEDFVNNFAPYAILSHTWGADKDEVTFNDMENGLGKSKAGYTKLQFCGKQARKDGLEHFWVDTCCINKANNTELSEAITSMFRWYRDAVKCYVYLSDVTVSDSDKPQTQYGWELAFQSSRWFTRGWTLQELLAPISVEFFSREGKLLGSKKTLRGLIYKRTGIPITALNGAPLSHFSVDERMLWAAKRETKRKEDKAYCLLGIFEIFIPLLYGEGDHAFTRLQEEIDKRSGEKDTAVVRPRTRLTLPVFSSPLAQVHGTVTRPTKRLCTGREPNSSSALNRLPAETAVDREAKLLAQEQRLVDAARLLDLEPIDERGISATEACLNLLGSKDSVDTLLDYRTGCLASLDFQEMGMREYRVARPELTTCQWIYKDCSYVQWAENANVLLWIKGKPGSGKSVLMKALHAQRDRVRDKGSTLMLKFFFNARGIQKEKTILGLYLALMHDLLDQDPVSMAEFLPIYIRKAQRQKRAAGLVQRDENVTALLEQFKGHNPDKNSLLTRLEQDLWEAAELADLFHDAIERESSKLIEIFVDALDECNEQEIREFITRCEQSIERAYSTGSRLRICWSSRYYPRIGLRSKQGIELSLDHHNSMDIETYVTKELANFPQTFFSPLKDNLLMRAKGVFLWVVLVIRQLRKFLDQGKRKPQLLAMLSTMPSELEDLFDQILKSKSSSPEDQRDFIGLLQWTFCSEGEDVPLLGSLQQSFEVYLSMVTQLGPMAPESISCGSGVNSHDDYVREVNRINDISCGLIDVRDAPARAPRIKGSETSSLSPTLSSQDMHNDEFPWRSTGDAQKSRKESSGSATIDCSIESGEQFVIEQEIPPTVRDQLKTTAGNTAKVQVIHESVRDFFLSSKRSLGLLQASSADMFLRTGHRDLAASCFQALLEFDSEEASLPWKPNAFRDEVMLVWRHREEFSRRFQRNKFLVYAQRHGLTHFSYAPDYFNNEKPSSSSVMESISARRTALRNYLRLICLFELEEETVLYKAFESNHRRILIQHHQMFGLSIRRLSALWPDGLDEGPNALRFSYPWQWNVPQGMRAPVYRAAEGI